MERRFARQLERMLASRNQGSPSAMTPMSTTAVIASAIHGRRRRLPDFRPSVSFAEGIRRSVAWYDARPRLKIPNPAVNGEMEKILEIWHRAESLAGG